MSDYLNSMQDFNPNGVCRTGETMNEKSIMVVDSLPMQTAVTDDTTLCPEKDIPKYLASKTIEVRRYTLKK